MGSGKLITMVRPHYLFRPNPGTYLPAWHGGRALIFCVTMLCRRVTGAQVKRVNTVKVFLFLSEGVDPRVYLSGT